LSHSASSFFFSLFEAKISPGNLPSAGSTGMHHHVSWNKFLNY
jgi:hypothetical protein